MELKELAVKQKRIQFWSEYLSAVHSPNLRAEIVESLTKYRGLLARVWEAGAISEADASEILNLERVLEDLNEQARLETAQREGTR